MGRHAQLQRRRASHRQHRAADAGRRVCRRDGGRLFVSHQRKQWRAGAPARPRDGLSPGDGPALHAGLCRARPGVRTRRHRHSGHAAVSRRRAGFGAWLRLPIARPDRQRRRDERQHALHLEPRARRPDPERLPDAVGGRVRRRRQCGQPMVAAQAGRRRRPRHPLAQPGRRAAGGPTYGIEHHSWRLEVSLGIAP